MKNELIESLRDLIECYDLCHDDQHPCHREITMWRRRFLKGLSISNYSYEVFMAAPCSEMTKTSPEEYLETNCYDDK